MQQTKPYTTSSADIEKYIEIENEMQANDRREQEKSDAKNGLEEYVYAIRDKVQGPLEAYMEEGAREAFCSTLSGTEDWLYEDGEDETKSVYNSRLKDLKVAGDAVESRALEAESRPKALADLQNSLVSCRKFLEQRASGAEKYAHIAEEQIKKCADILAAKDQWFNGVNAKQAALKLWEDPVVFTADLVKNLSALEMVYIKVMDTPVPVAEPPKEEEKPADAAADAAAAPAEGDAAAKPAEDKPAEEAAAPKDEMDID